LGHTSRFTGHLERYYAKRTFNRIAANDSLEPKADVRIGLACVLLMVSTLL
jgi:hypothetical protein